MKVFGKRNYTTVVFQCFHLGVFSSIHLAVRELKEEEEEGEGDSDQSYEETELGYISYPRKKLAESDNLPEGYVHLVKSKEKEADTNKTRKGNEYGQ